MKEVAVLAYCEDRIAAFENYVKKIMDVYEAPGISVVLAEHGKIAYQQNFGVTPSHSPL